MSGLKRSNVGNVSWLSRVKSANQHSGRPAVWHPFVSWILLFLLSAPIYFARLFVFDLQGRTMKHKDGAQFVWVVGDERRVKIAITLSSRFLQCFKTCESEGTIAVTSRDSAFSGDGTFVSAPVAHSSLSPHGPRYAPAWLLATPALCWCAGRIAI
jgi:hypothetical protein